MWCWNALSRCDPIVVCGRRQVTLSPPPSLLLRYHGVSLQCTRHSASGYSFLSRVHAGKQPRGSFTPGLYPVCILSGEPLHVARSSLVDPGWTSIQHGDRHSVLLSPPQRIADRYGRLLPFHPGAISSINCRSSGGFARRNNFLHREVAFRSDPTVRRPSGRHDRHFRAGVSWRDHSRHERMGRAAGERGAACPTFAGTHPSSRC